MLNDQAAHLRDIARSRKFRIEEEIAKSARGTRIIAVTSGKGGVGKTNIALNLALAFCDHGRRTLLLDADLGMANVDIIAGVMAPYNLYHVALGEKTISQVIIEGPRGLRIIPGGSGIKELANLPSWCFRNLIDEIKSIEKVADILVIDTAAGISNNVLNFVLAADEVLLVTTPEPTAITDAYGLIKVVLSEKPDKLIRLLINKARNADEAQLVVNKLRTVARRFLAVEVESVGYVLWDEAVREAVQRQEPFLLSFPHSLATRCIYSLAAALEGKEVQEKLKGNGLQGFFSKVFQLFR